MSANDDGGQAFPCMVSMDAGHDSLNRHAIQSTGGMSLRDYFAAMAMQGLVSQMLDKQAAAWLEIGCKSPKRTLDDLIAQLAYQQADAMLKARQS